MLLGFIGNVILYFLFIFPAGAQKLNIPTDSPGYEELTPEEIKVCSTLRFLPSVYLHMKKSMLTAVYTFGPYKKRDAQLWFRVDVNKTSQVYDWFRGLGWIPKTDEEWLDRIKKTTAKAATHHESLIIESNLYQIHFRKHLYQFIFI